LPRPLIVLDTAVVVTALLGGPESSNAAMIREIATGGVRLALSDDFLSELTRKVQDPNVEGKIGSAGRAFEIALDLAFMGLHHRPRRHPWRALRDPNDRWILDLAFDSGADYVVTWDRDLIDDAPPLGFEVRTPPELLAELRRPSG
jgi:putative PIN family toxin of toxin-antitoxin system